MQPVSASKVEISHELSPEPVARTCRGCVLVGLLFRRFFGDPFAAYTFAASICMKITFTELSRMES